MAARTHQLAFRVTAAERRMIRRAARLSKITLSEWVRQVILTRVDTLAAQIVSRAGTEL